MHYVKVSHFNSLIMSSIISLGFISMYLSIAPHFPLTDTKVKYLESFAFYSLSIDLADGVVLFF